MEYAKPWLSIDEQIDKLDTRGVGIGTRDHAAALLRTVGYYRLTGYLHPFRESEQITAASGRAHFRVLSVYRPGTTIGHVARLIDFDRDLRLLVLDAVERIEIALRTQVGHAIGRIGAFAHENPSIFLPTFTEPRSDAATGEILPSRHDEWLGRVNERKDGSDEAFVAHFREKYDDHMPIWALTEILELGHVSRLYAGLRRELAIEIANAFEVPTKRLMASWIATVNYVRNVAAHHARLFNRKLVTVPSRPRAGDVPLLEHLRRGGAPKEFGVYSALAVIAYLLRTVHAEGRWAGRLADLLRTFSASAHLDVGSMGVAPGWLDEELWRG